MTDSCANEIRERIFPLLNRIAKQQVQISDSTTFVGDLGFESIQVLELVVGVERVFDITIDTCDLERVSTVADLLAVIKERQNQP